MKILTAKEMSEADRRSVEAGVLVTELMENAGGAVARFCLKRYRGVGLVIVLCGKGNNGGDGLVAARKLAEAGRRVRVLLLGAAGDMKGDAAKAFAAAALTATAMCKPGSAGMLELREIKDDAQLRAEMADAVLIVDAVVGTGFKPPLRGLAAAAGELLKVTTVPIVAVDLPSGWDADSTAQSAEGAYRADAVVTFAAPKMAHVFGALTETVFGPVAVTGIGTPESAIVAESGLHWAGSAKAIAEVPRDARTNKGSFGHVLLIGGAFGKAGAPSMASLAAMRAGAGLVTAAVPREIVATVAAVAPELMLTPLATEGSGGLALEMLGEAALQRLLKGISVVAIGPGLGQEGSTPEFVRTFVENVSLPMVVDADALNAFAGSAELLGEAAKRGRTIVLTPHPGEMARLLGMTVPQIEGDRIGIARRFATEHGVTLVLKGWRTLVAHPDGSIGVNTTGNPAMAKGGSGDILTGIVAAMLAQYANEKTGALTTENVAKAVEAAVFLHGLAGDFATLAQDEHTVLATDTVGHLYEAFRARVQDEDGFTLITGTAAG
jgi:NAD(P)H-hydrate epimerase